VEIGFSFALLPYLLNFKTSRVKVRVQMISRIPAEREFKIQEYGGEGS
jgi:hypothetical protein